MICECLHPASAHCLGGNCDHCACEQFVPLNDLDHDEWEDEEADVDDFDDHYVPAFHAGWNDNPWADES